MTAAPSNRVLYLVVCAAPPARAIGQLISLLQPQGWSVCVIATPTAATWIDHAALTELTGYPVRSAPRQPDDPESLPKADAVAVVPATFNTLNKWVAGISDAFALGVLNEAIGLKVPVLVAPYAKATLAAHPAFHRSLETLAEWGVTVLPNEAIRLPSGSRTEFGWEPVVEALVAARRTSANR